MALRPEVLPFSAAAVRAADTAVQAGCTVAEPAADSLPAAERIRLMSLPDCQISFRAAAVYLL